MPEISAIPDKGQFMGVIFFLNLQNTAYVNAVKS